MLFFLTDLKKEFIEEANILSFSIYSNNIFGFYFIKEKVNLLIIGLCFSFLRIDIYLSLSIVSLIILFVNIFYHFIYYKNIETKTIN